MNNQIYKIWDKVNKYWIKSKIYVENDKSLLDIPGLLWALNNRVSSDDIYNKNIEIIEVLDISYYNKSQLICEGDICEIVIPINRRESLYIKSIIEKIDGAMGIYYGEIPGFPDKKFLTIHDIIKNNINIFYVGNKFENNDIICYQDFQTK